MTCASSTLVTINYGLTAVGLRADHRPTHQAQGGGLALPRHVVIAGEIDRHVH